LGELGFSAFYAAAETALGLQNSFDLSVLKALSRHREELNYAPRPSISADLGVFCSPLQLPCLFAGFSPVEQLDRR